MICVFHLSKVSNEFSVFSSQSMLKNTKPGVVWQVILYKQIWDCDCDHFCMCYLTGIENSGNFGYKGSASVYCPLIQPIALFTITERYFILLIFVPTYFEFCGTSCFKQRKKLTPKDSVANGTRAPVQDVWQKASQCSLTGPLLYFQLSVVLKEKDINIAEDDIANYYCSLTFLNC